MVALSRNVADKHAMEMLLTGDMTSAARAAEIGLVNYAVAPETLRKSTMDMARKIASKSSMTLATGKRAYYAQREMTLSEAYDYASGVMVDNMLAHDAEEGIGAFIEKRIPQWEDA
jgi:enoyl-CoA hydratase/carnithine racemase